MSKSRDLGIGLNGSVHNGILAVFILTIAGDHEKHILCVCVPTPG